MLTTAAKIQQKVKKVMRTINRDSIPKKPCCMP
jgi:hypothetical protein